MPKKYIPNSLRACVSGEIVTFKDGRRFKRRYESGEPLEGVPLQNDAPRYTGYVRDWFKSGKDAH